MPPYVLSSPPLRIDLSVSPALRAVVVLLALAATVALWRSQAPRWSLLLTPVLLAWAWPRAVPHGWRAWVLRGDGSALALDAAAVETELEPRRLQRRGPLTIVTLAAPGGLVTHVFTPDTLAAATRRDLCLWFDRHAAPAAAGKGAAHV